MTPLRSAQLALGLGLLIALAANLTYALPKGGVVVGLGLIAPLVLPVVLWLRTLFTADNVWHKLLREVATAAVAGPAVAISYSHTFSLVLDAHEPWLIAILAPLSSDGLAGLATLALHRIRATPVQQEAETSRLSAVEVTTPEPVVEPAAEPAPVVEAPVVAEGAADEPSQPMSYDEAVAWAIRHDAGAKLIKKHCGLTEHYAKKAREDVIAARALRIA